MSDLRELYQMMILEHGRSPRNTGKLQQVSFAGEGFNPLCGDKIMLQLFVKNEVIEKIAFEGSGCAISVASASLMTEALKGQKLATAKTLFSDFRLLVMEGIEKKSLQKLKVFAGVQAYPARIKCATLAWHTLMAAFENKSEPVNTESETK